MKRKLFNSAVISCALAQSAAAVDFSTVRPHAFVDLGANWVEDIKVRSIGGLGTGDTRLELDPGVRLSLGAGADFNRYLSLGVESGATFNEFDRVRGPAGTASFDGDLWQVPILGTLTLGYPNSSNWVPFIGGGAGAAYSVLRADRFSIGGLGSGADTSGDSFDFAYEGYGGLKYTYNERLSVGVLYKFFAIDSPEWDFDGTHARAKDVHNHSVSLVLGYRF